jgi:ATP-dependent Clp protease ATP-binding subunit ClpA
MFERFTASARRVVVLSQCEARTLKQTRVGPLHLLLGLLTAEDGTAGRLLASLGVEPEDVRRESVARLGRGADEPGGHIPFSPGAKKAFDHSLRESLGLDHSYIGTEHMLLGLIADPESDIGEVLDALGVRTDAVRDAVMVRLGSAAGVEPAEP